ncbi:MAG: type IV secretory system conjugative DNA transfer family protein [Rickettsiales bacterium]
MLLVILIGCGVASAYIVTYLVAPPDRLPGVFADAIWVDLKNVFIILLRSWKKLLAEGFVDSVFPAKVMGGTVAPFFMLGSMLFMLRAPLSDWRPFKPKEQVFGDARWADERDIRRAGLRSKKGMLLGRDNRGEFLIASGFQHALLFAPTGSGKGVGFVIPNLLFWEDSVIVHDIKLENYDLTSGYRNQKLGQRVFVWNPADPDGKSHCYNPIDWISSKPGQMVDDVQKISNLICPNQEFWENEARSLFVGVVLYLLAVPEKMKTFGEVVRTMRSDDVTYNMAVVLDTMGSTIHPVSYMNIAAFLQKADKERSGVVSTLNSKLELWANPLIDTATATSDFNIMEFKNKATTIYVGVTPDNLQRLQPLLQVFYQQATQFLSRRIPGPDEKYGVMFMLDEFPTLGKMDQFMTGIAYFRGYRVRLFLIVQDTQQLKGIYEDSGMNSFLSNSTYRITFAANNYDTADLISKLTGNKTVKQTSLNSPKFLDLNPASRSVNLSEAQRALLLPQEVIGLDRDKQILLIESSPPIMSKKIKYYEDKMFTSRLLTKTDVPTQEPFDQRAHISYKSGSDAAAKQNAAPAGKKNANASGGGQRPSGGGGGQRGGGGSGGQREAEADVGR